MSAFDAQSKDWIMPILNAMHDEQESGIELKSKVGLRSGSSEKVLKNLQLPLKRVDVENMSTIYHLPIETILSFSNKQSPLTPV